MTPLRQRMIDAMVLRGFRPRTQESYLRVVAQMARHYRRTPELITDQEVQAYLLHLVRERHLAQLVLLGLGQLSGDVARAVVGGGPLGTVEQVERREGARG